jgi:hypothetical protein
MAKIIYTYTDEECETYHQIVSLSHIFWYHYRGRILGRSWTKVFPPCYSQSPLLTDLKLKLGCNVSIVYGNLMSENSQDYVRKPQRNCTSMNSSSGFLISPSVPLPQRVLERRRLGYVVFVLLILGGWKT